MKKAGMLMMVGILSMFLAGCGDPCKDDAFTKIGDSIATMGKKDMEKQSVLAQRAAERAGKCAQKKGGDMKKSLGLLHLGIHHITLNNIFLQLLQIFLPLLMMRERC